MPPGQPRWVRTLRVSPPQSDLRLSAAVGPTGPGRRDYQPCFGSRRALAAGYLSGLLLVAWIAIQLLVLQRYFFLQPVIAGLGTAEILLARTWQRPSQGGRRWPGRLRGNKRRLRPTHAVRG